MKKDGRSRRFGFSRLDGFRVSRNHGIRDFCGYSKDWDRNALWAMNLYNQLEKKRNIHIRRLHYFALSRPELTLPGGRFYSNTLNDLGFLKTAFEHGRLMGLIPFDAFSDHRMRFQNNSSYNPSMSNYYNGWRVVLRRKIEEACRMHIRAMQSRMSSAYVEVWLERTSATDIIQSTAEKYNLNIVASESEIPLTSVWHFIRRVANVSKPVCILYFCDFDRGVVSMPAIDKLKSALYQYGLSQKVELDVQKLVLNRTECNEFGLPCRPVDLYESCEGKCDKEVDAAELHALEVAVPGYICNSLERHLKSYIDVDGLSDSSKSGENHTKEIVDYIEKVLDSRSSFANAFEQIETMINSRN